MIKGTNFQNNESRLKETHLKELKEINLELKKQISILKTREEYFRDQLNKITFNKKSIESRLDYHTHQLMHQNRKCEMLETDMEDFYYAASHHLKTPIRNISSFAQLLQKGYLNKNDSKKVEFMDFVTTNAQHLHELLEDLLFYITFTNQTESTIANFLLENMMKSIQLEMQSAFDACDATLIVKDLPMVRTNTFLLKLLVRELFENALKFKGERSIVITVDASYKDNYHIISVRDNGLGLSEAYASKVFALFGQLDNTGKYPGTGMGLALCRKIIQILRGRIWYTSDQKNGTTFHFTLPDQVYVKK